MLNEFSCLNFVINRNKVAQFAACDIIGASKNRPLIFMIVRPRPSALQLFFIVRGSIIRHIAPKVLVIILVSCMVVWLSKRHDLILLNAGVGPFSILGLALSVFMGFRNNACYDRWWEARKQWGGLIVQARVLARELGALLEDTALRKTMVYELIGFAHVLAARLRNQPEAPVLQPWLGENLKAGLDQVRNLPDFVLRQFSAKLSELVRRGLVSDVQYQTFSLKVAELSAIQGACERIKSTPTPFPYSLLLHRTAWLYCLLLPFDLAPSLGMMTPVFVAVIAYTFFGLDYLGDELEEPFGLLDNDLPLNALVRIIEVDLRESLGETNLPPYMQPENYVLF